jgi:putative transposase
LFIPVKKGQCVLCQPDEVIFAWIDGHRTRWPLTLMCRVLEVSRSGYYAWRGRPRSASAQRRDELVTAIQAIHAEQHKDTYGSPRITAELHAKSIPCCVNTVAKVMKQAGIAAKAKPQRVRTTDSNHTLPVAENVLDRDFTPVQPNVAWVGDITYVRTQCGWLYLALMVDLFSRRIVGWSMDITMTSALVVDALRMAVGRRKVSDGLIVHTDRGSQYCSEHYQQELAKHEMVCSMSRRANCWDNAVAESTFGRIKSELVHRVRYATAEEAKASLFEYVEVFWNRERRHSTLGYVSPADYERSHHPDTR